MILDFTIIIINIQQIQRINRCVCECVCVCLCTAQIVMSAKRNKYWLLSHLAIINVGWLFSGMLGNYRRQEEEEERERMKESVGNVEKKSR